MEQFDREDTSTYNTNNSEPAFSEQPQPVAPVPQPEQKRKKSKAPLVLSLFLLLAMLCAATFGWMWYQQSGRLSKIESDLSVARNDVARFKSTADAEAKLNSDLEAAATPVVATSDKDQLIALAKAYGAAEVNGNAESLKIVVAKVELPFARVDVSQTVGGAACVYKKVRDQWLWLYCAQGGSDDTMRMDATYGVPKSLTQS